MKIQQRPGIPEPVVKKESSAEVPSAAKNREATGKRITTGTTKGRLPAEPKAGSTAYQPPLSTTDDLAIFRKQIKALLDSASHTSKKGSQRFSPQMNSALSNLMQTLQPLLPAKDIKPNLLIVKQLLREIQFDGKKTSRDLMATIKNLLQHSISHIEQQQLAATQKSADPDVWQVFSHLIFLSDDQREAKLKLYYHKKNRKGAPKPPRVSLQLALDRLGMVRTDLWMMEKNLNISFFVQNEKVKEKIRAEHERMEELLGAFFQTVVIKTMVNEKKINDFDNEDRSLAGCRQVDVTI